IKREAARQYGKSFFELAKQAESFEKVAKDMDKIAEMLADTPDALKDVQLPETSKAELGGLISLLTTNAKVFRELYDDYKGIQEASFESAVPVPEDLRKEIIKKLEEKTQKTIRMHFSTNKKLIAGFRLNIGEKVIDCSVANQLNKIRRDMLAVE
ncbi:MAG: F0F1 ATP synthase subunit delta, partial [Planctomycetota bacterium]